MPELDRIVLPELGEVLVRELRRPEDDEAYLRFGAAMEPDDLRMRFAVPTRWSPALAQRMLMLNGAAFAAFGEDGEILGIGRLAGNEIALTVRSELKRRTRARSSGAHRAFRPRARDSRTHRHRPRREPPDARACPDRRVPHNRLGGAYGLASALPAMKARRAS